MYQQNWSADKKSFTISFNPEDLKDIEFFPDEDMPYLLNWDLEGFVSVQNKTLLEELKRIAVYFTEEIGQHIIKFYKGGGTATGGGPLFPLFDESGYLEFSDPSSGEIIVELRTRSTGQKGGNAPIIPDDGVTLVTGWYVGTYGDKSQPYNKNQPITADIDVWADTINIADYPNPVVYRVNFSDYKNTPAPATQYLLQEDGEDVFATDPSYTQADFLYWKYLNTTVFEEYDFTLPVDREITLIAEYAYPVIGILCSPESLLINVDGDAIITAEELYGNATKQQILDPAKFSLVGLTGSISFDSGTNSIVYTASSTPEIGKIVISSSGFTIEIPVNTITPTFGELFVFTIETPVNNTSFYLPTEGILGGSYNNYDWLVDWGDGAQTIEQGLGSSMGIPHNYAVAGEYNISITPNGDWNYWLGAFGFSEGNSGASSQSNKNMMKLINTPITQQMFRNSYDVAKTQELMFTFYGCQNLQLGPFFSIPDAPNNRSAFMDSTFENTNIVFPSNFRLPTVGNINLNAVFFQCLADNNAVQTRSAMDIIGLNDTPNARNRCFEADSFPDQSSIPSNWK